MIEIRAKVGSTARQVVKANWFPAVDKRLAEVRIELILPVVPPYLPAIKLAKREKRAAKEFLGRNSNERLA